MKSKIPIIALTADVTTIDIKIIRNRYEWLHLKTNRRKLLYNKINELLMRKLNSWNVNAIKSEIGLCESVFFFENIPLTPMYSWIP
jgi:hypothetical protein